MLNRQAGHSHPNKVATISRKICAQLPVSAMPPDVRWWLCPTGREHPDIPGLRPVWGGAQMPSGLPEGHSPSAHRAAKPQQRFHVVSAIWVRIVHRLIENGLKG